MNIEIGRFSRACAAGLAIVGFGTLAGCLSDDKDSGEDADDGSGGTSAGTSGSGGTAGSNGGTSGSSGASSGGTSGMGSQKCLSPLTIPASKPAIADFEVYDGMAVLKDWSFPLGGDTAGGILAGVFGYGDNGENLPETFEMIAGDSSTWALSISDTLAEEYGGGLGIWISECLDATAFSGISFRVRGNSPTGDATFKINMRETTSSTASTADDAVGTCTGTDDTCKHPSYVFPVTDAWTEVQVAWSAFTAGDAAGTPVTADGHNIWQLQFDVGLVWVDGGGGVYVPTPAPYDFAVDDFTFY